MISKLCTKMFDLREMMLSNFLGVDNNSSAFLAKQRIDEVPFGGWGGEAQKEITGNMEKDLCQSC